MEKTLRLVRGAAIALIVCVEFPMVWRLDHLPHQLWPDPARGAVVPHDCRGVVCYVTPLDNALDRVFFVVGAICLASLICTEVLFRRR